MSKLFNLELLIEKLKKNSAISLTEKNPNEPYHSYSYNKETNQLRQIEIKDPPIYDHKKAIWDPSEVGEPEFLIGVNLESDSIIQAMIYFFHDGYTDHYPLLEDSPDRKLTGISVISEDNILSECSFLFNNAIYIPFKEVVFKEVTYETALIKLDLNNGDYSIIEIGNELQSTFGLSEMPAFSNSLIRINQSDVFEFYDPNNEKTFRYNISENTFNQSEGNCLFIICNTHQITFERDFENAEFIVHVDTSSYSLSGNEKAYVYYNETDGLIEIGDQVFDLISGELIFTIPSNVSSYAILSCNSIFYIIYYVSDTIEIHEITDSGTTLFDTIIPTELKSGESFFCFYSEYDNLIYIQYFTEESGFITYSYNMNTYSINERDDIEYPDFSLTSSFKSPINNNTQIKLDPIISFEETTPYYMGYGEIPNPKGGTYPGEFGILTYTTEPEFVYEEPLIDFPQGEIIFRNTLSQEDLLIMPQPQYCLRLIKSLTSDISDTEPYSVITVSYLDYTSEFLYHTKYHSYENTGSSVIRYTLTENSGEYSFDITSLTNTEGIYNFVHGTIEETSPEDEEFPFVGEIMFNGLSHITDDERYIVGCMIIEIEPEEPYLL